jgi:hypothetical protein
MKTIQQIKQRIDELKADERLYYPSASVFANAPLALLQNAMAAELNALEWALDIPKSKFPLVKAESKISN